MARGFKFAQIWRLASVSMPLLSNERQYSRTDQTSQREIHICIKLELVFQHQALCKTIRTIKIWANKKFRQPSFQNAHISEINSRATLCVTQCYCIFQRPCHNAHLSFCKASLHKLQQTWPDQNFRPYDSRSAFDSGGSGSLRATKLRASSGNFDGSSMMLVFEQSFASLRNASFLNCCKDIRSPSQSIAVDCISWGLMLDTSWAKEWTKWPMIDVKTQ